jgi:hypothetical protein
VFDDLHCSLGGDRSFTDPVTNWVMIASVSLDDLVRMFQAGGFSKHFLPAYMHEMVHHMCFESPVGLALALLQLRARRLAVLSNENLDDVALARKAAVCAIRAETALTMMRPLAEGLALFVEFDAFPTQSSVMSNVLRHATLQFGTIKGDESLEQSAVRLLLNARCSEDFVRNKSNLLLQSLSTADGGYLAGYLTVKNLREILTTKSKCSKLLDSDLHFMYLRAFFYEDYALVRILLDQDLDDFEVTAPEDHAVQSINVYLQKRFDTLIKESTDTVIGKFEESTLAGINDHLVGRIGSVPTDFDSGMKLLQAGLDELQNTSMGVTDLDAVLRNYTKAVLARRHLMCIGSCETRVTVNEHGQVLIGEHAQLDGKRIPIISSASIDGIDPCDGIGTVDFFISPRRNYTVMTTLLKGKCVAILSMSEGFGRNERDEMRSMYGSLNQSLLERKTFETAVNKAMETGDILHIREHYRVECAHVTREIYAKYALIFVPDSAMSTCRNVLDERGFYSMLEQNSALVRSYAAFSLVASTTYDQDTIEKILALSKFDLKPLLESLKRSKDAFQMTLYREFSGELILSYA